MKTVEVLQFNQLSDLTGFMKFVHLSSYLINAQKLTLKASLNDFEIAIAIEQYGAALEKHKAEA